MELVNQRDQAEKDIEVGEWGRQVLNNPLYKEFMVAARADLFGKLESSKFKEHEERNEIWRKLQTLKKFEHYFVSAMQTGQMGEQALSRLDKLKAKLKVR